MSKVKFRSQRIANFLMVRKLFAVISYNRMNHALQRLEVDHLYSRDSLSGPVSISHCDACRISYLAGEGVCKDPRQLAYLTKHEDRYSHG